MNTRDQLNQYLESLQRRLRWMTISRGAAVAAGVALGATVALVLVANAFAFSSTSVTVARTVLFLALASAVGFALVIPLMALNRRRTAGKAESSFPEFKERLVTFVEKSGVEQSDPKNPMLDLLAMDTMSVAQRTEPQQMAPRKSLFALATSAGAFGAVLIWLIAAGPGFLGYGASLLWAGTPRSGAKFYDITVQPGDKLIRRRSDQMVTAQLTGFQAETVRLYARYKSAAKWEEALMASRNGSQYEFLFAGLPEPVEYYVEASGVKTKTYKLDVIDLPGIKHIKVTYHYPSWLGVADTVEDPGGDLRAVAGTTAELTVETDKPLANGVIDMDSGAHISLDSKGGNMLTAQVPIQKDGVFHFAAKEQGESVRLSEDYFIEAREDNAPSVKIIKPGSDARVSPIEEVMVQVEASDDFALNSAELHYSVNGGDEKVVPIPGAKGAKTASGRTMIALEDYKMSPGDVIAMYATAKDARNTSRTDMVFIEAQPFERNYTQSQQAGGGGGGGSMGDQDEISQREKEIIAATWNEIRGTSKDKAAENARFLAEVQTKLKEQAKSLADRARARQLAGNNQEFQNFVKDLDAAAAEMDPASDKLKGQSWKDALGPEQRALQHLLRAEATFRDIQVAFGGGGGGGGAQGAGRDLASMFDLELDREKNQYETGQRPSGAAAGEQQQKDVDDALQRLKELARRQQELAQQQNQSKQQTFEQRWQQEMLRREAEELKKQMEQLARDSQGQQSQSQSGQQQGQQSQGQSQGQGQSGQSGKQGQQNQQQMQQALDRLNQALNDMRAAQQAAQQNGQQNGQQGQQSAAAQAEARRAAERLADAERMLNGLRQQQSASQIDDLAQRAEHLTDQQKDFANRLQQAFGGEQNGSQQGQNGRPGSAAGGRRPGLSEQRQLAEEKDKMAQSLDQLERDMQKASRDMAGTQPGAASRVRDGLSDIQQTEAKMRMQYSARWIRDGQGALMVPREGAITQAMEQLTKDLKAAQGAVNPNAQAGDKETDQQLARLERLRSQMQQMLQDRQQARNGQGNQPGGNQQGNQSGQGQSGQGQGQNGQGNANGRAGANRFGGGGFGGNFGRFQPEGIFDPNGSLGPVEPGAMVRDAQAQLNDLKERFSGNQDMTRDIDDVSRDLSRMTVGNTASPELDARISREVLPKLEALEVQLRRQSGEEQSGQVRSGATDRTPAGYTDAVAEYFRKLSKGR